MIEIIDSPKHLVAMRLSGELTGADVEKAYEAANNALKDNERISFFAEVGDSINLTLDGACKDAVNGIWQFGKLKQYYRAAVVTDSKWLGALSRIEGLVFSSMDVRVFEPADRDKAFAWASEEPEPLPKPHEATPSIHLIQTTSDNVFAYEVDGPIFEKDVETALRGIKDAFEHHQKINVLARVKNWAGFELASVLKDELFKVKYQSLSKVDKYAVVGGKPWMRNFLELIDPLISPTIRVFDASEEAAAWEWVGSQQALLAE